MKTIIIYNTTTGNTKAIANKMKDILEKYNHKCEVFRDKEIKNDIQSNPQYFNFYGLICLGSCTHGGQPAISFMSFINSIKSYDLEGKDLVCFSSSGIPGIWKATCNKIMKSLPEMNHIGNFGCSFKNYDSTMKEFEELVKIIK
ncbi:MAG: flavodoxin family protein [Candidatus Hermodarchaeota archaeon]